MLKRTSFVLPVLLSLSLLGACATSEESDLEDGIEDATESVGDAVDDASDDGFWDQAEGNWSQFTGSAKERWGELTDDELLELEGNKDSLVGAIQERYGIAKEEAEAQVEEWRASFD